MGAWGRQKVTPLSLPSTWASQLEAAAWAYVGRLDHTWLKRVHFAMGLQHTLIAMLLFAGQQGLRCDELRQAELVQNIRASTTPTDHRPAEFLMHTSSRQTLLTHTSVMQMRVGKSPVRCRLHQRLQD